MKARVFLLAGFGLPCVVACSSNGSVSERLGTSAAAVGVVEAGLGDDASTNGGDASMTGDDASADAEVVSICMGPGGPGVTSKQYVAPAAFAPDTYPETDVASPYGTGAGFTAVHGSLQFLVDMPSSSSESWSLGVDFTGIANICTLTDPATGELYDAVSLSMSWAADSGGAYNVFYGYLPYMVGFGPDGPAVTVQSVYVVDGGSVGKKASDCLTGASEEHPPFARDIYLTPNFWVVNGDLAMQYQRLTYKPWTPVGGPYDDIVPRISDAYAAKGNKKVSVVLGSHGTVDTWVNTNTGSAFDLYTGNNQNVQTLLWDAGKVSKVVFESCCTGKGYTNGLNPNLLDSASAALTKAGDTPVTVCGWNHTGFTWFRGGAGHVGHTKTDTLACSH